MTIKKLMIMACVFGVSGPAVAQTAKTNCAPTQAKPNDPNGLKTTGSEKPLTEKLADSGGVLCPPPATDPEIRVAPPSTGSNMPVVPPPGSPGGDPAVKPK